MKRLSDYGCSLRDRTQEEIFNLIQLTGEDINILNGNDNVDFDSYDIHFECNGYHVCYDLDSSCWECFKG